MMLSSITLAEPFHLHHLSEMDWVTYLEQRTLLMQQTHTTIMMAFYSLTKDFSNSIITATMVTTTTNPTFSKIPGNTCFSFIGSCVRTAMLSLSSLENSGKMGERSAESHAGVKWNITEEGSDRHSKTKRK